MKLKNYQVSWIIAQSLLSDGLSKLTTTWDNIDPQIVNEFKSILNSLTQSMVFEVFAYTVYRERKPIIYNIGKYKNKHI